MVRVTTTDRRGMLRAGAGLVAGGALAAGCSSIGAAPYSAVSSASPSSPSGAASPRTAPAPRAFPRQPAQITHGPRDRPRAALPLHGQGDPALARALPAAPGKHGARLTVLAVGTRLAPYPRTARRIRDGGHDLGNHTQRHPAVNAIAEGSARAGITGCADRPERLTGSIGTWFRPSRTPTASPLVQRPARADGYPDTVGALTDALEELDRRGLNAVTTTELLS
jgi:hypothetical protein